jgi:hypothetical protein
LLDIKPLDKLAFGEQESRGCAKRSNGASGVQLAINNAWTNEECTAYLKEILPQPMGYAEDTGTRRSTRQEALAPVKSTWVLATKSNRKLAVVPNCTFPTGYDLAYYSIGEKGHLMDKGIYIGKTL